MGNTGSNNPQQEDFIPNFPENENNIYLIQQESNDYLNNKMKKLMKINIMVVGITGVGKSTFINSYFKDELAKTSFGFSCTNQINYCSDPSKPLAIYDTPGLELDQKKQNKTKKLILNKIKEKNKKGDKNEYIHLIFYCVNLGSGRLQTEEEQFMKEISTCSSEQIPIIIVITKAFNDINSKKFKENIENRKITNVRRVVPIVAKESLENYDGTEVLIKAKGEENLINAIDYCLPDYLKKQFQTVKIATMINKRHKANSIITLAKINIMTNTINYSNFWIFFYSFEKNLISNIAIAYDIDVSANYQNNFLSYTIGEEAPSNQEPLIFSQYRQKIRSFEHLSDEEIQSPQMSGIITHSVGLTYISFIEKIFKDENYLDQIDKNQLKNEIKDEFKNNLEKEHFHVFDKRKPDANINTKPTDEKKDNERKDNESKKTDVITLT